MSQISSISEDKNPCSAHVPPKHAAVETASADSANLGISLRGSGGAPASAFTAVTGIAIRPDDFVALAASQMRHTKDYIVRFCNNHELPMTEEILKELVDMVNEKSTDLPTIGKLLDREFTIEDIGEFLTARNDISGKYSQQISLNVLSEFQRMLFGHGEVNSEDLERKVEKVIDSCRSFKYINIKLRKFMKDTRDLARLCGGMPAYPESLLGFYKNDNKEVLNAIDPEEHYQEEDVDDSLER